MSAVDAVAGIVGETGLGVTVVGASNCREVAGPRATLTVGFQVTRNSIGPAHTDNQRRDVRV